MYDGRDPKQFTLNALKRAGMLQENQLLSYMKVILEQLCQEEIVQKSDTGGVYFLLCKE